MLLTFRSRRAALSLPLLLMAISVTCPTLTLHYIDIDAPGAWKRVLPSLAFGAVTTWLSLDALVWLRVRDDSLRVWKPFHRYALGVAACAVGVRFKPSSKAPSFAVFITDGRTSVDIDDFANERRARRAAQRVENTLLANQATRNANARHQVRRIEDAWQANVADAQKKIDAYYQSPTWRRVNILIVGGVIAHCLGMLVYLWATK